MIYNSPLIFPDDYHVYSYSIKLFFDEVLAMYFDHNI